ncbi:SDR family oxidoreductase [Tepidiforma sp.]|uniref:SDR family NAD(P)-dependent oxidoreductase n=1 Tax=Tepidiforma sp. TaxID=2682230 RepID=UPI002ADE57C6|nr:SDR family oxidoreductase [Tepidiforma sp.]
MDLRGGVVIVTGSATGVGAACARLLASKGCNVVINYTKSEAEARETEAACREVGVETLLVQADVADDADCRRMAAEAVAKWGRIDGLINNAGVTKFVDHTNLEGLTAEDFQRIYAVNVIGAYQMTRAVAPQMKSQGRGAVVNISSIAGVMGIGSSIAYAASKGALNTMTLSLARALGPEIRVNAICPGFIQGRWLRSGMGDAAYEAAKAAQERTTPLRRAGTPEDMAQAAVWFLEGADHVTGELLIVDAGAHLAGAPLIAR